MINKAYIMSRKSLKEHCEMMCKRFREVPTSGTYSEHAMVLDLLKQTEWIPVSKEVPKYLEEYIVTRRLHDFDKVTYETCVAEYHGMVNDKPVFRLRGDIFNMDVVAWMPLPEPHKPEGSDNENNI